MTFVPYRYCHTGFFMGRSLCMMCIQLSHTILFWKTWTLPGVSWNCHTMLFHMLLLTPSWFVIDYLLCKFKLHLYLIKNNNNNYIFIRNMGHVYFPHSVQIYQWYCISCVKQLLHIQCKEPLCSFISFQFLPCGFKRVDSCFSSTYSSRGLVSFVSIQF